MLSHSQFYNPVILESEHVALVPLHADHIESLAQNLFDPETFFVKERGYDSVDKIADSLVYMLQMFDERQLIPFVMIDKKTATLCGRTSFMEVSNKYKRVEIGYTWIATSFQKTYVNSEVKKLMLDYAFNVLQVERVEFAVDPKNEKSNKAMLRLGAKLDGCMRRWRMTNDQDPGDRNIYSILKSEYKS